MSNSIVVLMNAGAGTHATAGVEASRAAVAQAFARLDATVEIRVVDGAALSESASAAVDAGAGIVVAAGGDGTVSAVAQALIGRDASLGVLPLGTLNHFSKDLGVPSDIDAAVAAIMGGRTLAIDVVTVNGRFFINNSSIGLYPRMVQDRDRQRRKLGRRKFMAMGIAAWRALRRMPLMRVRIEAAGRRFRRLVPFVFVGNNEYSFQAVPMGTRARLDSGRMWMYFPSWRGPSGLFRFLMFALFQRAHEDKRLHAFPLSEATLKVRGGSIAVGLDGEVVRLRSPLRYRILPNALRVLVPVDTAAKPHAVAPAKAG